MNIEVTTVSKKEQKLSQAPATVFVITQEDIRCKAVNGRPLACRRIGDIAAARSCHVLLVSRSEGGRVSLINKTVQAWNVLTVSDVERFCKHGSVVAFLMDGQRVRFQINPAMATAAGLKISSNLLQSAVVRPEDKEKD